MSHVSRKPQVENLFDPALAAETRRRVLALEPHSQPLWGTMTVAQALAHCTSGLAMAMGDLRPRRMPFPVNLLGKVIKPLLLADDKPMRRNSPSSPELFAAQPLPAEFDPTPHRAPRCIQHASRSADALQPLHACPATAGCVRRLLRDCVRRTHPTQSIE